MEESLMAQEKRTTHEAVDIVPGRHILVPIATADSAQDIIDMAFTLMKPGEGHVTVLGSPPTGNEDAASNYAEIAAVVQKYINEGRPIRLRTKITATVTRSILEAVREWAIDVLLLPLYRSGENDKPSIGNVVDNIVATTSCSVLIYRPAEATRIDQIVVPVLHEAEESLAKEFRAFLDSRFDQPTQLLAYKTSYERKTTPDNILLAIAVSDRSNWESWEEIVAADQRILGEDTPLLVLFLPEGRVKPLTTWEKAKNWLNPKVAPYEEAELVALQEESGVVSLDYVVLIIIAAILASLGLILNSNAVIIGAMLVAPLMAPLIAFSTGMAIGDLHLTRNAIIALLVGILLALGVSYLIGRFSATTIVTSEMAGRGNPTFLDLAVALASGVIGAYAAGRKSISSAAAGVAIAAALMPPLCTVGLAYAFGDSALSRGAFLLFLTNIISIILAATITFFWLGLRSYGTDEKTKRERQRTSNILVLLFIAVLVALWIRQLQSTNTARIETVLQESFQQADLVNFDVREEDPLQVLATIRQPIASFADSSEIIAAKQNLETSLEKEVNLQVVVEPFVDAASVELRAELDEDINQVLTREMPNIDVVDFTFVIGNPSLVVAGVATELDQNSEAFRNEVQAAENALAEVFGVPTELVVVLVGTSADAVEAVESADVLIEGTIHTALVASMPSSQIESFTYQYGNPTFVDVVVISELEPESEAFQSEVRSAEEALEEALDIPVRLSVEISSE
jgi:uncharacterized hydrophobic protein (TIGR00271 family)